MNDKFLFIAMLLLVSYQTIEAQENYTEKIPGTKVSFDMVYIKGGTFQMGSSTDAEYYDETEGPQREVKVDDFWIGKYEVTYDEYILFQDKKQDSNKTAAKGGKFDVDAATRPTPPYVDMSFGMGTKGGFPIECMTQQAALYYCKWLYQKTGNFYRLPTEAEWEYACKAGTNADYPPEDLKDVAWYVDNSDEKFQKVGQKKPNAWGLYDMLGNVAEWTIDHYEKDYHEKLEDGAENPWIKPTQRYPRTVRGGSYDDSAEDCHCSARLSSTPRWQQRDPQIPKSSWWNTDSPFVGLRVVRPAKQLTPQEIEAFFAEAIKD